MNRLRGQESGVFRFFEDRRPLHALLDGLETIAGRCIRLRLLLCRQPIKLLQILRQIMESRQRICKALQVQVGHKAMKTGENPTYLKGLARACKDAAAGVGQIGLAAPILTLGVTEEKCPSKRRYRQSLAKGFTGLHPPPCQVAGDFGKIIDNAEGLGKNPAIDALQDKRCRGRRNQKGVIDITATE